MKPFTTLEAAAVPVAQENVDTDQIIPARFLKKPRSADYGNFLFHDLRRDGTGAVTGTHPVDRPAYAGAEILVADRNFGCGSSREGAVYALVDGGFRCVIAPSFGDIFYSNATKNGLLPIRLPRERVREILAMLEREPGAALVVDLEAQTVVLPDQTSLAFEIDPGRKRRLLQGLDDIALTLTHEDAIAAWEAREDAAG